MTKAHAQPFRSILSILAVCMVPAAVYAQTADEPVKVAIDAIKDGKSVDAKCVVKNDKGEWQVKQTPSEASILFGDSPLIVTCSKTGQADGKVVLLKSHNPENSSASMAGIIGAAGFGLIGGLIGGAIEANSESSGDKVGAPTITVAMGKTSIRGDLVPATLKSQGEYEFDYGVMESSDGLKISLNYSKYQFIPDRDAVREVCVTQTKRVANAFAAENDKKLKEISDSAIKVSTRRNAGSGMTSCQSTLSVGYVEDLTQVPEKKGRAK